MVDTQDFPLKESVPNYPFGKEKKGGWNPVNDLTAYKRQNN